MDIGLTEASSFSPSVVWSSRPLAHANATLAQNFRPKLPFGPVAEAPGRSAGQTISKMMPLLAVLKARHPRSRAPHSIAMRSPAR